MPLLSRVMIRLALINWWVGFTIAMLLLSWRGVPDLLPVEVWRWLPAHINLLLVGWMVQLSMGVAYWILPRLPQTVTKRGRYGFALSAVILINVGLWAHVGAILVSPWLDNWQMELLDVQVIGLVLQVIAVLAFAVHAAPRVRPAIVSKNAKT